MIDKAIKAWSSLSVEDQVFFLTQATLAMMLATSYLHGKHLKMHNRIIAGLNQRVHRLEAK